MFKLQLIRYAFQTLQRRWQKVLGLLLIYTCIVGFYASILLVTTSLRHETQTVLQNIPEIWIQKIQGGRLTPLPITFGDSLLPIRGVKEVLPRIWGYYFDSPTGALMTLMSTQVLPKELKWLKSNGRSLDSASIWVGQGFLRLRQLELGDFITLVDGQNQAANFQINGVFEAEADLLTADLLLVHPAQGRRLLGLKPNEVTDFALTIHNPQEADNIARKIDKKFAGLRIVSAAQLRATYQALFSWRGALWLYGSVLALLAFLILVWERASGIDAAEKKELALLRAVGWQVSDVLWMKLWQGFMVGFAATLQGILLAYYISFVWQAPFLRYFFAGWSVLYPNYKLQPVWEVSDLVLVVTVSLIPYLSATLYPAWRGAIIPPAEAMQKD